IYLQPLGGLDLMWIFAQLKTPDISSGFAFSDVATPHQVRLQNKLGLLVLCTIRRVADRERIGFAAMLAPNAQCNFWEILSAIPERAHRDGFSMLHTVDAMSHYMFDHLHVETCGARVRTDNKASRAV